MRGKTGHLSRLFSRSRSAAGTSSDDPSVHDHHKRHHDGQADQSRQKAQKEPPDSGKSRQPGEGGENDEEVQHLVHLLSVLFTPCGQGLDITTQRVANVPTCSVPVSPACAARPSF
jgi:hypothetical protein